MSDVLFPQRPASNGVQTPSTQQSQSYPPQQQQPSNDLEVIVLRPSIRPPSYEEVAASTASPGRFNSAASSSSASPRINTTRILPSTHGETPYNNISSLTVPKSYNTANQQQHASSPIAAAQQQNRSQGLVQSGKSQLSSSTAGAALADHHHQDSTQQTSTVQQPAVRRQGSPRKLACWHVGMGGGENVIPTLKYRTIGDTVKGCLTTNDHRPLTNKELKVDWKRICALAAGHELYKLRPPYVSREEFADPLKFTSEYRNSGVATVLIPSGYVTTPRQHPPAGSGKIWDHVPWGQRPTARQNTEVALKPTQIDPLEEKFPLAGDENSSSSSSKQKLLRDDPYSSTNFGSEIHQLRNNSKNNVNELIPRSGEKVTSRALMEASAVPLNIPPANPIIEEADRRLQQRGFGGLAQVGRASDEAVSHLLKVCGFPDAQRLVILWEIRKAKRK